MAVKSYLDQESKKLIEKHQIFILGENTATNELLFDYFTYELKLYPSISTDVKVWPVSSSLHGGRRLVLIDCLNRDIDRYIYSYELTKRIVPYFMLVALYNLDEDWTGVRQSINTGIKGFFYKNDSLETMVEGIFSLYVEQLWIPKGDLFESMDTEPDEGEAARASEVMKILTKREKQMLDMLRLGLRNSSIAERLKIQESTVKTHIYNLYQKIGVGRRQEAMIWANQYLR